jgi:hypothetical protein
LDHFKDSLCGTSLGWLDTTVQLFLLLRNGAGWGGKMVWYWFHPGVASALGKLALTSSEASAKEVVGVSSLAVGLLWGGWF